MFDAYSHAARHRSPTTSAPPSQREPGDSDFVYRQATRAKALDAVRGMLPAASLSNVGIYGTGQAFEALLLRMRAHPLPEARALRRADAPRAAQGHPELPAPGRPPRPRRPLERLPRRPPATDTAELVDSLFGGTPVDQAAAGAHSSTGIPTPRTSSSRRSATRTPTCPRRSSSTGCARSAPTSVWRWSGPTSASGRTAATSRAGPSSGSTTASTCSATTARSATCSATGMLTIEWQRADPEPRLRASRARRRGRHGRGVRRRDGPLGGAVRRAAATSYPHQASYAVSMAYRLRYSMQFNAREAIHMLELRSSPQGHPAYRRVALEMHRLIGEQAGHRGDRRGDDPHDHGGAGAGTARRRAARRGATRPIL